MNGGILRGILALLLSLHAAFAAEKWAPADLILKRDASGDVEVPPNYWADQERVGKYRLDGLHSVQNVNCIFLEFYPEIQYARKEGIWSPAQYAELPVGSLVQELWVENPLMPNDREGARMLRIIITAADANLLGKLKSDALLFLNHNAAKLTAKVEPSTQNANSEVVVD